MTSTVMDFVKEHYYKKFGTLEDFDKNYKLYLELPIFKANENIHEKFTDTPLADKEDKFITDDFSLKPEVHWIMRMTTQYYLTKAFEAMKIDLTDENVSENALGKGTPGRIAKMWVGDNPEDTSELGSGRWNKQPYVSTFPNTNKKSVITKTVDLVSCCSHHFLPFTSMHEGKVSISYIPKDYVIGISKLQRLVNWAARRFWLQEDLTDYIGQMMCNIAETDDVKVEMTGIVHGCEKYRGANAKDGTLTTCFVSGCFKE